VKRLAILQVHVFVSATTKLSRCIKHARSLECTGALQFRLLVYQEPKIGIYLPKTEAEYGSQLHTTVKGPVSSGEVT
jgi:competence CoiA-like predicted nuclease